MGNHEQSNGKLVMIYSLLIDFLELNHRISFFLIKFATRDKKEIPTKRHILV